MATLSEKPMQKYSPNDWFTNNYLVSLNAERSRDASHNVRQESVTMRNLTDNKTVWDKYHNDNRLDDRVVDIEKWKRHLERTLAAVDKEIEAATKAKSDCEDAMEAKRLPLDVSIENLTLREGRRDIDLVRDDIEHELKKEVEVNDACKKALQQKCNEAFEQICLLQEARQQLLADIQDKGIAREIDVDQLNLTENSAGVSFKPDPLRVPKGSISPQEWEDFSRYNVNRAEEEMKSFTRLREAILTTIQNTDNDMEAQKNATEYALRRRIHETERALGELEWQKKTTEDEIAKNEAEVANLEDAIRAKLGPSKLAETRLENRTARPNMELCRDEPQYGLSNEVLALRETVKNLNEQLSTAKHALDGLQKNLHRVNDEIALKENSLMLDQRCADSRMKLNTQIPSDTDRNLKMTGIDKTSTKILSSDYA